MKPTIIKIKTPDHPLWCESTNKIYYGFSELVDTEDWGDKLLGEIMEECSQIFIPTADAFGVIVSDRKTFERLWELLQLNKPQAPSRKASEDAWRKYERNFQVFKKAERDIEKLCRLELVRQLKIAPSNPEELQLYREVIEGMPEDQIPQEIKDVVDSPISVEEIHASTSNGCSCNICITSDLYRWATIMECKCHCHKTNHPTGHSSLCCPYPNGKREDNPYPSLKSTEDYMKEMEEIDAELAIEMKIELENLKKSKATESA